MSEVSNTIGQADPSGQIAARPQLEGDAIPGLTPPQKSGLSKKAILALSLAVLSVVAVSTVVTKRFLDKRNEAKPEVTPEVASATAHRLRLGDPKAGTLPTFQGSPASAPDPGATAAKGVKVPAITEQTGDAKPLAVVPNGQPRPAGAAGAAPAGRGGANAPAPANPMDAPVFASQTRTTTANRGRGGSGTGSPVAESPADEEGTSVSKTMAEVRAHKERLEAELARRTGAGPAVVRDRIAESQAAVANRFGPPILPDSAASASGRRLLGTLEHSGTGRLSAQRPFDRSLTVAKGTIFHCALQTRIVTATSGFINCLLQRDVYGHDGKVVLAERGSTLVGEYRMTAVRPGLTRIPVVWTRLLTPHAVSVELESPAVGALGESGIDGYVDNRWPERVGAALLVSLVDDALQLATKREDSSGDTVLLPSTSVQGSKLAEEVMKSTINIPPLLYRNQGGLVGVYVAHDLDFSNVYKLHAE